MPAPVELLTMTEFAQRVGVTQGRVSQLVKAGRLPITPERKVIWPAAKEVWNAMHLDAALAAPSTRPQKQQAEESARGDATEKTDTALSLTDARARKEAAKARLAELDLAEREGELIPFAEVRADAVAVLAAVRASLLSLPGQVALRCEGRSAAEIEQIIAEQVNSLLAEWHTGRWGG